MNTKADLFDLRTLSVMMGQSSMVLCHVLKASHNHFFAALSRGTLRSSAGLREPKRSCHFVNAKPIDVPTSPVFNVSQE